MPNCAAYGCSVRPGRGKRMHNFPRDPIRRKLWEQKVRRKNWKANNYSILCEDHFDETQYENGRVDGLRRLKPNALPTHFVFTTPKRHSRPTKQSRTEDEPCVGGQQHIQHTQRIQLDHAYYSTPCSASLEVKTEIEVGHEEFDRTNNAYTGGTVSEEMVITKTISGETVSEETAGRENVSGETASVEEQLNGLKNKVLSLQRALVKERKEKWKIIRQRKRLEANVSGVFNTNQLYKLSQASTRGTKWSADSIKKGLQLMLACGPTGYNLLLAQNQPLPSARSLQRRLHIVREEGC
ncbi:uncharacterized protein LOC121712272 [Alosa sapidissima]|uniref:uncharacterized protein LOC121712272 n=1 Tax=Alosa sapidissima TaxID=34773 RepID=UPI001C098DDD|nr:uncharacterized protein LOC121712272 [Alosa sapidissima]